MTFPMSKYHRKLLEEAKLQIPGGSYDPTCMMVAEHFFRDHPLGTDENVEKLARHIRNAVSEGIAKIEEDDDK